MEEHEIEDLGKKVLELLKERNELGSVAGCRLIADGILLVRTVTEIHDAYFDLATIAYKLPDLFPESRARMEGTGLGILEGARLGLNMPPKSAEAMRAYIRDLLRRVDEQPIKWHWQEEIEADQAKEEVAQRAA